MEERPATPQTAGEEAAPAPPLPEECHKQEGPAATTAFPSQFARIFFAALTLLILYFSYLIVKPYLIEIFLSLVLFITSKPLYHGLTRLLFGQKGLASALTCLLLAIFIILPILLLTGIIAGQALELYNTVNQGLHSGYLWQQISEKLNFLQDYLAHLKLPIPREQFNVEQLIQSVLTQASHFIYSSSIGIVKGFTSFIFSLLLVLFVTFFLFLSGDAFIEEIKRLSPLEAAHNEEILGDVENTIIATLKGTVIVAVLQGVLTGVGLWWCGVPKAAFWGTVTIPASVIPVVGAALIWAPAALYLFFLGHTAGAIGLTVWCVLAVGSVDNVLKPYLMKGARYAPPIFILFAIMGGLAYFGLVGFILGPLILSFLLSLLGIYQKTVLQQTVDLVYGQDKAPGQPARELEPKKQAGTEG